MEEPSSAVKEGERRRPWPTTNLEGRRTYTLAEYGEITGLSMNTVRAHARRGCIPGQAKVGGRYLIARAVIDGLIRRCPARRGPPKHGSRN